MRAKGKCMFKWQKAANRNSLSQRPREESGAAQSNRGILGEEGATLVEMAVSSATLFCVLFGIIWMCMALYSTNFVSEAARDAARWAIVRGSTSCGNTPNLTDCNASAAEIQTYVQNMGYPGITSANLNVTTTWLSASATQPTTWTACASVCNAPGNEVEVAVSYSVPFFIPFVNISAISVSSTSEMVISQ